MNEMTKQIGLVVMAAGFGRRYGSNKLLDSFQGKKLYQYTLELAAGCSADSIVIVTRFSEIKEHVDTHYPQIKVIWNEHPERGISESLKLGLKALGEVDGCCFMVCDQPLLERSSLEELLLKFRENPHCIVACNDGQKRGNPVIFSHAFFDELMELSGDQGGRQIIGRNRKKLLEITVSPWELMDIDCVDDRDKIEYRFKKNKKYMR